LAAKITRVTSREGRLARGEDGRETDKVVTIKVYRETGGARRNLGMMMDRHCATLDVLSSSSFFSGEEVGGVRRWLSIEAKPRHPHNETKHSQSHSIPRGWAHAGG
jgi:hypothetical protein